MPRSRAYENVLYHLSVYVTDEAAPQIAQFVGDADEALVLAEFIRQISHDIMLMYDINQQAAPLSQLRDEIDEPTDVLVEQYRIPCQVIESLKKKYNNGKRV